MALQYGVNITASDMRNILEKNDKQKDGVRSWRQLFGNASLGYESQADALKSYYSDAMAQAYKTNFAQQNAIMGAGLNVGATRELMSANRQELQNAYDTYIKNYGSSLQNAATNYSKEVGAIDNALTERATNFANLYDSAYKYLSNELYGSTISPQGGVDYLSNNGLDWLTAKNIDGTSSLKSWNDAKTLMMNDDGTLNARGVSFFDKIFNARPEQYVKDYDHQVRTFDEWLSEENNELRNWLGSQDAFNYTFAGTNLGTANTLTGRNSTDMVGEDYEYITNEGMEAFDKDFGAEANSALAALNAAEKKSKELAALEDTEQGEQSNSRSGPNKRGSLPKSGKYKRNGPSWRMGDNSWSQYSKKTADDEYKKAQDSWLNYIKETNNTVAKISEFFKNKVGSKLYNEFTDEQKDLFAEYNTYLQKASNSRYYDEAIANKISTLYRTLVANMKRYISQHGYNGKSSGF